MAHSFISWAMTSAISWDNSLPSNYGLFQIFVKLFSEDAAALLRHQKHLPRKSQIHWYIHSFLCSFLSYGIESSQTFIALKLFLRYRKIFQNASIFFANLQMQAKIPFLSSAKNPKCCIRRPWWNRHLPAPLPKNRHFLPLRWSYLPHRLSHKLSFVR